jgi:hypothetical protein
MPSSPDDLGLAAATLRPDGREGGADLSNHGGARRWAVRSRAAIGCFATPGLTSNASRHSYSSCSARDRGCCWRSSGRHGATTGACWSRLSWWVAGLFRYRRRPFPAPRARARHTGARRPSGGCWSTRCAPLSKPWWYAVIAACAVCAGWNTSKSGATPSWCA